MLELLRKLRARWRALRGRRELPLVPRGAIAVFEAEPLRRVEVIELVIVPAAHPVAVTSLQLDGAEQLVSDAGVPLEILQHVEPDGERALELADITTHARIAVRNDGAPSALLVAMRVRDETTGMQHVLAFRRTA